MPSCEQLGLGRGEDTTGGYGSLRFSIERGGGVLPVPPVEV